MIKIAKFGGVVVPDNISDNYDGQKLQLERLHIGPIDYDFENKKTYSIFSKNLSINQRFDMGFETILGLNAIDKDIFIKYRHQKCDCGINYWGSTKNFELSTSLIGDFADRALNLSDMYFEFMYQCRLDKVSGYHFKR